jgi:hypothetical protein
MRYSRVAAAAAVLLINFAASAYQEGNGSSSIQTSTAATSAPVNNVQPVVVDYGPTKADHLAPYPIHCLTVTICARDKHSKALTASWSILDLLGSASVRGADGHLAASGALVITQLAMRSVCRPHLPMGSVAKADVKMAGRWLFRTDSDRRRRHSRPRLLIAAPAIFFFPSRM